MILTPDQRLRVFISSTLGELAAERKAARAAVTRLRLSPVMFELGARPHPPRDLYAAYLEQSQVFVGIYWQSYGWVAPEMEISGIEDEYLLAKEKPRLIYVKAPAPDREERLARFLDEVKQSGVSYKTFSSSEQLGRLLADDLALLMTERFHANVGPQPARETKLPFQPTVFVGRSAELEELAALLADETVHLLTLVGPGGVGKTRLALEAGARAVARFRDGAAFVPLASVGDPRLLPTAIADAVRIDEFGLKPSIPALRDFFAKREMLLLLDNVEQVLPAAPVVAEVLESAPDVTVLATSREPLQLRGELEFPVAPMSIPASGVSAEQLVATDAGALFVERARATRHDLTLDDEQAGTIAEICRKVDGLPLAIELAAARLRVLSPSELLQRLNARLETLVGGARDMPERQKTLRNTIAWSFEMLDERERTLFARLAVFARAFTAEAMDRVCGIDEGSDLFDALCSLVEKSLVVRREEAGRTTFAMLGVIHDFAWEQLAARGEGEPMRERHARFVQDLIGRGESISGMLERYRLDLRGVLAMLDAWSDDLRVAMQWFIDHGEPDTVADMMWSTAWPFWWVRGQYDEARRWIRSTVDSGKEMSTVSRAKLITGDCFLAMFQGDYAYAIPLAAEAFSLFEDAGHEPGLTTILLVRGLATSPFDAEAARADLERAQEIAERTHDRWGEQTARTAQCWRAVWAQEDVDVAVFEDVARSAIELGDPFLSGLSLGNLAQRYADLGREREAIGSLSRALEQMRLFGSRDTTPYMMELAALLLARRGNTRSAGHSIGAAEAMRESIGAAVWGTAADRRDAWIDEIRAAAGDDVFARAREEGRALSFEDSLDEAVGALEAAQSLEEA
ncbi:MAG: DUF4062 domain-containing protein, partial [Actinomycetota bacterium]